MRYLTIHICISGFTQNRGRYHGILKLRERLIEQSQPLGVYHRVWYAPWVADWSSIAADVSHLCDQHNAIPVISISGYSYGGYGAIKLCSALKKRCVDVQVLNLCDPVGRRWWWPRPLPAITSLFRRKFAFRLRIPDNVRLVNEFYQQTDRPQGHKLRLSQRTERGILQELKRAHVDMDDAPEFHDCVVQHAKELHAIG